jgi:hypothetical protein
MHHDYNEPITPFRVIRHDGWTGKAMAKLLETRADTGIVIGACDAAGKCSIAAYALRRRNPQLAQGWQADEAARLGNSKLHQLRQLSLGKIPRDRAAAPACVSFKLPRGSPANFSG